VRSSFDAWVRGDYEALRAAAGPEIEVHVEQSSRRVGASSPILIPVGDSGKQAASGAKDDSPAVQRQTHNAAIRQEFSKPGDQLRDPAYSFGNPRLLHWILSNVPYREQDLVLDVAAGTGHLARALAAHVHHVVALDLTVAMLETGQAATRDAGIENVLFQAATPPIPRL
jgi:hypothetical protein